MQCDIRLVDEKEPLLPGTKVVILLGEYAMHSILPETRENTIGEMRGSVFNVGGVWYVPTFYAQDAMDLKNYEKENNPLSRDYAAAEESDEEEADNDGKRHGRTSRKNYAFWMRRDVWKAKQLLKYGKIPEYSKPDYRIAPSVKDICQAMDSANEEFLYFDMETDYEEANLQCFSFAVGDGPVFSVPILDHNYRPYYCDYHRIFLALFDAVRRNTIVAHNGANFDFFVLGYKYHIPVVRCYDTMLAFHRCFPDIEKSLGHATSYFTWERFHKDEDSLAYFTPTQVHQRMVYCGKDVYTMRLIHKAITQYATTIPGLTHSIETAMRSIRPYLTTSLQGIRYDPALVAAKRAENDKLMEQYIRIINLLIGQQGLTQIRSGMKGKISSIPGSNPQCVKYFHEILGYPVVSRGRARDDGSRHPSLAAKAMYKLRLANDNPVIDFIIAYRQTALETRTPLGFTPWRDDNNNVIDIHKYHDREIPASNPNQAALL